MNEPTKTPLKHLPAYHHPPETKEPLKYANLTTIDLGEFDKPGGKEKLAAQLKDAVHNVGFFFVTNFGLSPDEINRQYAIGREFFALPEEVRRSYRAPLEDGIYNGYRPLGSIQVLPGLYDNIEFYNILKFLPQYEREHPEIFREHWAEIERFHRHVHDDIALKLLRLIALVLELPEEHISDGHLYESNCDSGLRYMNYRARSAAANERFQELYSRGHTDNGTITLLFQQPVAALQVRRGGGGGGGGPESPWEWIRVPEGVISVNVADVLSMLSGGYLRSGVHRVVVPPEDQRDRDRLGLLYFVRPSDRLPLRRWDSPLLRRWGCGEEQGGEAEVPASEWTRARIRNNWSRSPTDADAGVNMAGFSVKQFYD